MCHGHHNTVWEVHKQQCKQYIYIFIFLLPQQWPFVWSALGVHFCPPPQKKCMHSTLNNVRNVWWLNSDKRLWWTHFTKGGASGTDFTGPCQYGDLNDMQFKQSRIFYAREPCGTFFMHLYCNISTIVQLKKKKQTEKIRMLIFCHENGIFVINLVRKSAVLCGAPLTPFPFPLLESQYFKP